MTIGEQLKEKRQEANLSQKELAEQLHVSRQTVSSWEVGRTYPDLDMLVKISQFYTIALDELLKEDSTIVKDISKKVRKSERRKVMNVILAASLVVVFGFILMHFIQSRQNAIVNDRGLSPKDLIESSWELSYSPSKEVNQSFLSFDHNSIAIYNMRDSSRPLRSNTTEDNDETLPGTKELLEKGIEDGTKQYSDLSIELDSDFYVVTANAYSQRFKKLSDSIIRDIDGNEYRKILSQNTHKDLSIMDNYIDESMIDSFD